MTTDTRQLDTMDLEAKVKSMYERVALDPHQDFHFETSRPLAERLGYPAADLDLIPAESIDSFAGVGYFFDLAALAAGETVLDLGSGSGMDSFLAQLTVGPSGTVIGVDMTSAQLDKARRLATGHVDFRQGYIEEPPVEAGSVDCVISNGVINLVPDKHRVFAAAARALRSGGRLAVADIVTAVQLPEGVTSDATLWAACIGGQCRPPATTRRSKPPDSTSRPSARTPHIDSCPTARPTPRRRTALPASPCWPTEPDLARWTAPTTFEVSAVTSSRRARWRPGYAGRGCGPTRRLLPRPK
jgi:arsenite methyltransferase